MIVHLNGMPGVGKLTVARLLAAKLPARLIDNHLFVDLAEAACDRGDGYLPLLNRLNAAVYDALAERGTDETIVMTNALADDGAEDAARFAAVHDLAKRRGVAFVPVRLHCAEDVNTQRLLSGDRALKKKLRDPAVLKMLRDQYTIIHPADHPHALDVDTTALSAEVAAEKILAHLKNLQARHDG